MNVVTREFAFDMGHMLPDHEGACYRPHGHRYRGELSICGPLQEEGSERGMVADFAALRDVFDQCVMTIYDHRFAVCVDDPRAGGMRALFEPGDLIPVALPPTVENLAMWIGRSCASRLEGVSEMVSVRLWETPNCSALWTP